MSDSLDSSGSALGELLLEVVVYAVWGLCWPDLGRRDREGIRAAVPLVSALAVDLGAGGNCFGSLSEAGLFCMDGEDHGLKALGPRAKGRGARM